MQSKRMYHALKGHGATCRLVLFPYESHRFKVWYILVINLGRLEKQFCTCYGNNINGWKNL